MRRRPASVLRLSMAARVLLLTIFAAGEPLCGAEQNEIVPQRASILPGQRRAQFRRSPIYADPVEAQIVAGKWSPPTAETTVRFDEQREEKWLPIEGKKGAFDHASLRGGYAYVPVTAEHGGVYLLEAGGHRMVYVNGTPCGGDIYGTGWMPLPVELAQGSNDLLFAAGRGGFRVKLYPPPSPVMFSGRDDTLPNLIVGEAADTWAGVVVVNATTEVKRDLTVEISGAGLTTTQNPLPLLVPLGVYKIPLHVAAAAPQQAGKVEVVLKLCDPRSGSDRPLATRTITLDIRNPAEQHRRTYRSEIDGSVQYYSVKPAHLPAGESKPPGMILTLHGAGVEADGQAASYAHHDWAHIVAATNRRPYGFDWEDWGRLDALEALADAQRHCNCDPRRTYLTGHSMGGHGTWHVGVTFPDRFAAIGPSAGWVSFFSYAGAERPSQPTPVQELLARCMGASDTLMLKRNLGNLGVYVLHGDADDNVPVGQARTMRLALAEFHPDFVYYEQPGAGHWWSAGRGPATDCVDWPPMFRFFQDHLLPEMKAVRRVEFITASPGVSARCHWATIWTQARQYQPSSVALSLDPKERRFVGQTDNVARLRLDLAGLEPDKPLSLDIDGVQIKDVVWPKDAVLWLVRQEQGWTVAAPPSAAEKGPARCGPFKLAFNHHVVLVYGTKGSAEENAWALNKARYDAETFYYRGNGLLEIVADGDFTPERFAGRSVVLYGNADTNAAWKTLLADSPVQVGRGVARVGHRELSGDSPGGIFVRPRADSGEATVAAVTGTGVVGMRAVTQIPYLSPGVAFPDCLLIDAAIWQDGPKGIRVAGFFGNDWTVDTGEFVWAQ